MKNNNLTNSEENIVRAYNNYLHQHPESKVVPHYYLEKETGVPRRMIPDFLRKLENNGYIENK